MLQLGPMEPSPGLTFFCNHTHNISSHWVVASWVGSISAGVSYSAMCSLTTRSSTTSPCQSYLRPEGSANAFRDIVVVQDCIKYVDHHTEVEPWSYNNNTYISNNWTVIMWSRKFTPNCWQRRWTWFSRDASIISGSLHKLQCFKETTPLPPLQKLHTGHLILSLDELFTSWPRLTTGTTIMGACC